MNEPALRFLPKRLNRIKLNHLEYTIQPARAEETKIFIGWSQTSHLGSFSMFIGTEANEVLYKQETKAGKISEGKQAKEGVGLS